MSKKNINKDPKIKELTKAELASRAIKNLTTAMEDIEKKNFRFMFFVMDTKGMPNGSLSYIYSTAKKLNDLGYKVCMLHAEKDFVGVGNWLGDEYAKLKHYNIESDAVKASPADFLIIPELYSNVMYQTMKLPCKRIVLLQSRNFMTEVIQPGSTWADYGIVDCITTSAPLENHVKDVFPVVRTNIVRPLVDLKKFGCDEPKKAFINIVTKSGGETSRIVKEFFWKQPAFKWVTFRDIKGLSKDEFSNALKESFATVWCDETTDFGVSALEAMAAGNVVIGRVPEEIPEWMADKEGNILDNGAWFYRMSDSSNVIANVIESFLMDSIPQEIYDKAAETAKYYSEDAFTEDIKRVYIETYVEGRKKELTTALGIAKNNLEKEKESE